MPLICLILVLSLLSPFPNLLLLHSPAPFLLLGVLGTAQQYLLFYALKLDSPARYPTPAPEPAPAPAPAPAPTPNPTPNPQGDRGEVYPDHLCLRGAGPCVLPGRLLHRLLGSRCRHGRGGGGGVRGVVRREGRRRFGPRHPNFIIDIFPVFQI